MRITKFGHSCLLIEEQNVRILTDPGSYSTLQNDVQNLDVILITHKHQDHLSCDSLEVILKNNPQAKIFTNQEVAHELKAKNIFAEILETEQTIEIRGVSIEAYGKDHATILANIKILSNTGYLVQERLFIPGDAFTLPPRSVEILALPVCAPWSKLSEIFDYAKAIHPKIAFPIHDGMLKITGGFHRWLSEELPNVGVKWSVIEEGQTVEW